MSIASEINNYRNGLGDAYDAVDDMGGIIPQDRNMNNLDTAIRTIPQSQGGTYTAGNGITINAQDEISIDDTVVAELSDLPGTMTGATSGAAGTSGLVPAPAAGDQDKYLKGDGTWATVQAGSTMTTFYWNGSAMYKDSGLSTAATISDVETAASAGPVRIFSARFGFYEYLATDYISVNSYFSTVYVTSNGKLSSVVYSYDSNTWSRTTVGIQKDLTAGSNITISGSTISATDTTYSAFTGATSSVAGSAGLVPAPTTSDPDKFLKGDGTWATVSGGSSNVTTFYTDESLGTFYKDAARTQVATYAEVYDSFGADKIVKAVTSNVDDYCETYEYIIMPVYDLSNCSYSDTPEIKYLTGTTFRRPGNYGSDNGVILRTLEPRTDSAGYPQAQAVFDEEVHPAQEFLRTLYLHNVGGTSNYSLSFAPASQTALDKPTIYRMLDKNKSMYIADSGKNVIVSWKFATVLPQQTAEDTYIIYAKKNDLSDAIELWKLTLASPSYDTLWERTKIATIGNFTGATSSVAGESGLVPAPAAGDQDKFLKGDGTWGVAATQPTIFYCNPDDIETAKTTATTLFYSNYDWNGNFSNPVTAAQVLNAFATNKVLVMVIDYSCCSEVFVIDGEDDNSSTEPVTSPDEPAFRLSGSDHSFRAYFAAPSSNQARVTEYTNRGDFFGATQNNPGIAGLVPAPAVGDQEKVLHGDGTWKDTTAKLVEMSYGEANAWTKFINAYNAGSIVYCRASSAANPATGSQTRKAFMAYVNNAANPTNVEFQYVRSVSSKTEAQPVDQVFVYTLTNTNGGTWSVASRNMGPKIAAGTGINVSYSNGTYTISLA